ncbi:MAG TPA: hypothetical protein ENI87_15335 [bacterium]|nr:hypothetical protein [bacterium]
MTGRRQRPEAGFALIVMLGIVGSASFGILLAVQALVPPTRDRQQRADQHLATTAEAARVAFRRNGAFSGNLDALAQDAGLDIDGAWRRDPFGSGRELAYRVGAAGAQVRSCGQDGVLDNSDDVVFDVPTETRLRVRQRLRLRLLRAVLARSEFRVGGAMTASDEVRMATAMREHAAARRQWLTADEPTRASLQSAMATTAATIDALVTAHGLPALPGSLTGAGGLMSRLGMQDSRARDGAGAALQRDDVLGWRAIGADRVEGSDDDM